jgi:conjugal transfer pilin signal peptidase TrbI
MEQASLQTDALTPQAPRRWLHSAFGIAVLLVLFVVREMGGMPIGLVFDPNREHCLTDFHLGLFVRHTPARVQRDELVYFKPIPALSYVRDPYVLKRVAAVPGDHVVIKNGVVTVNGHAVVHGLPLAGVYNHTPAELARDETVPQGRLFVVGNADLSDDSRYWGYLESSKVVGTATRLF